MNTTIDAKKLFGTGPWKINSDDYVRGRWSVDGGELNLLDLGWADADIFFLVFYVVTVAFGPRLREG